MIFTTNFVTFLQRIAVRPKGTDMDKAFFSYRPSDLARIPERPVDSNKSTFGRVLVIGGASGMSGAAYSQQGKIKKIAVNTFLITPYYVDLMGEDDLIDELENKGLNF